MQTLTKDNDILLSGVEAFIKEGRSVILKARGNSMLPFIFPERDSVQLEKAESLSVGDIVLVRLYRSASPYYVMHRIIRIEDGEFTMMGDGNVSGVEKFRRENVIAKVTAIVSGDGKSRKVGKASVWRALRPVRRYLLAFYRRIPWISRQLKSVKK